MATQRIPSLCLSNLIIIFNIVSKRAPNEGFSFCISMKTTQFECSKLQFVDWFLQAMLKYN